MPNSENCEVLNGTHPEVERSIEMVYLVLGNDQFYEHLRMVESFVHSTALPGVIVDILKPSELVYKIELFYPLGWRVLKYRNTYA